jgi:hypothetical protein
VIRDIDRDVDSFEVDKIMSNPISKCKIFDINMACPGGWFLHVTHGSAAIVILVCNSCGFLGDVKVPQYAVDKE